MTYYVPDWDDTSHSLKVSDVASFYNSSKGGAHPHQHRYDQSLQKKSSAALVPNHDFSESLTHMGMQGDVGSHITGEGERASVPALDIPLAMSNACIHEDEMLSWLRYPLEDSFDRNYCSEMFGELVNPHVHLVKDTFIHQTMRETESTHELTIEGMGREQAGLQQLVNIASMHCTRPGVKSDAAMAMGAERAAGLVSQTGSEAFTGVRTHVHPSSSPKPLSPSVTEPSLGGKKTVETYDPMMSLRDVKKTSVLSPSTPSMSLGLNFSLFMRPVATTLDNLRIVGAASGPTNVERARKPLAKDLPPPCEPSIGDSNGCVVMSVEPSSQQSRGLSSQVKIASDGGGYTLPGWSLPTNLPCRPDVLPHRPDVRMLNETAELNSHTTCFSGSAITISENALGTETAEATVSPSRLSGSSTEETAEEAFTSTAKKKSSVEYTEDVEDVTANAKKPPPGPRAIKRGRAAETHNESEKKRRNKINVRLKALQSLIPNSNKTDKASILDEAIEYTKMLQAQVQFMSMRTGTFVPQMMMPSGVHYVPVHQMPLSHMGMGMGMGFGMGSNMGISMRVTDINAATAGLGVVASVTGAGAGAGAVLNLPPTSSQSPSRQAHAGARLQQTSSAPLTHDVSLCLPTSCTDEPYSVMLAQQSWQPMPMNAQRNLDMYNVMVQQRQPQENNISNVI